MVIIRKALQTVKHWFAASELPARQVEVNQRGQLLFYPIGWNGYNWNERNFEEFVQCGYGRNPYVFMVVDKIASIIASLPYVLKNSKGEVVKPSADLAKLLSSPNSKDNWYELIYRVVSSYEVTGNAYIYSTEPIGFNEPDSIECAITQDVTINTRNSLAYGEPVSYQINYVGTRLPAQVLHIKRPNILNNTAYGLSSLYSGQASYTASNNTFEAGASIHKNRGASGVISPKDSNMTILEDDRTEMQNAFDRATAGAHNTGKTYVSTVGVDFKQIGMSATDLKLIEFNIEHLRTICSLFGVSSALFNDPANKTYNNMKEAKTELYKDKLLPLASNIMSQLSDWLIRGKFKLDASIEIDTSKIDALHEDMNAKHQRVNADLTAGILTVPEARAMLYPELPPLKQPTL